MEVHRGVSGTDDSVVIECDIASFRGEHRIAGNLNSRAAVENGIDVRGLRRARGHPQAGAIAQPHPLQFGNTGGVGKRDSIPIPALRNTRAVVARGGEMNRQQVGAFRNQPPVVHRQAGPRCEAQGRARGNGERGAVGHNEIAENRNHVAVAADDEVGGQLAAQWIGPLQRNHSGIEIPTAVEGDHRKILRGAAVKPADFPGLHTSGQFRHRRQVADIRERFGFHKDAEASQTDQAGSVVCRPVQPHRIQSGQDHFRLHGWRGLAFQQDFHRGHFRVRVPGDVHSRHCGEILHVGFQVGKHR